MRILTSLLCKVTLSSMILTAPSPTGSSKDDGSEKPFGKNLDLPYYTSTVIKSFVNYSSVTASPVYAESALSGSSSSAEVSNVSAAVSTVRVKTTIAANVHIATDARFVAAAGTRLAKAGYTAAGANAHAAAKAFELRMVIDQAVILYNYMDLQDSGLDEQAFEYAWRGYHNLLKRGLIHKRSVLSICDFSQPSYSQRLYVIDVRHKKLLYRTYVAHGQNSGGDYATSFSNEPESFKSSLGFYLTSKTYIGRNGLSLRIKGVDPGYNDMASKRNIVLHGSNYVNPQFVTDFGTIGTSLGCPALPTGISPRIIRAVKNGSCLFIYHPTKKYLEESVVING